MNEYERTIEDQIAVVAKLERELDMAKAFHVIAVKERDLERVKVDRLTREVERLTEINGRMLGDFNRERDNWRATLKRIKGRLNNSDATAPEFGKHASGRGVEGRVLKGWLIKPDDMTYILMELDSILNGKEGGDDDQG